MSSGEVKIQKMHRTKLQNPVFVKHTKFYIADLKKEKKFFDDIFFVMDA
jgi:hypothetical protein